VLTVPLHPVAWDDPDITSNLAFPRHAAGLAAAGCSQDCEFQAACGQPLLRTQFAHEFRDLLPRQCGVIFDLVDLAACGEQVFEMPGPACRVLAGAVVFDLCPIQNFCDPPPGRGSPSRSLPSRSG
jgi:hypothetical protein